MTRRRASRIARAFIAVGAGLALASCGTEPPVVDTNDGNQSIEIRLKDENPGGPPVSGGRLKFQMRLEPANLDPHKTTESAAYVVTENIYESLLESVRGDLRPAIAKSWTISPDGLTYTFQLTEGLTFHSGRPLLAEDVKYSLERVMDPATASPRAQSFKMIRSIDVPDDLTVVLNLSEVSAPLLSMLAAGGSAIVDREVAESSSGLNGTVDGGSGPFVLKARESGQRVVLDKNPNYRIAGLPYLDGIDVTWSGDDNARAAAIRSGTTDFLWRAAPEFIDALKADPGLKWYGGAGTLSLHARLNVAKAPFDDVRVRQALFYAVDRQALLDTANSGHGQVLRAGYLPADRYGALTTPVYGAPDLEKAKQLLSDAGYADGFKVSIMAVASSAFQTRQGELLQQQLAELNIDVELEFLEATVTSSRAASGDFDIYLTGLTMSIDPDDRLSAGFSSTGGSNYGHWSDAEYDDLLAQARRELDVDKRAELYQKSERILAERGPVIFSFVTADYDVVAKNVMGYDGDPTPSFRFYKHLWLSDAS